MQLNLDELKTWLRYDPLTGLFSTYGKGKHGRVVGYLDDTGYIRIELGGRKRIRAHRLAWIFVHGQFDEGEIDHINGDRTDNRITNLRLVSKTENQHNRCHANRDAKTAKVLGVCWYKAGQCWKAQIQSDGKKIHLGYHPTIEAASAAYRKAKDAVHPTHKRLRSAQA